MNQILKDNLEGSNDSFIYFLHEESIWNDDLFIEFMNSVKDGALTDKSVTFKKALFHLYNYIVVNCCVLNDDSHIAANVIENLGLINELLSNIINTNSIQTNLDSSLESIILNLNKTNTAIQNYIYVIFSLIEQIKIKPNLKSDLKSLNALLEALEDLYIDAHRAIQ